MNKSIKTFLTLAAVFTAFGLTLTSCNLPAKKTTAAASPTSSNAAALPTAAPAPRTLTVCLGEEPNTLYPFGAPNAAARSVLAAIDDGPIDTAGYAYQPVILTQLPSMKNGDAQIVPLAVQAGSPVVDAQGNLVQLDVGTRVRPSGCRADDCVITYDGTSALQMDQMVVNFHMRPDLTWSDGTPLTSDDSVYAYSLASDPSSQIDTFLIDRTQSYETTDANTVQWWGRPGFIDATYFTNFFAPAPKHAWSQFPASQLASVDLAAHAPLGWGAYTIQQWVAGDHVTLTKNAKYFRAAQGLPKFDILTFRFIVDPDAALSELVAGRCDILDPSIKLDAHAGLLQKMQSAGQAQAFFSPSMTIEWLGLGIVPASYDDGYNTAIQKDRQDIFADAHTREGIAYCLDRASIVKNVLFGLSTAPTTYLPIAHPLYDANIAAIPFDPSVGITLLEQAGWKDTDGNPATPRVAVGVKNVAANTPLQLNYYTTTAAQRRQVVDILTHSLAQCGIGVTVGYFSPDDLYAPGPNGLLFGRRFDLIEYAMGVNAAEPPCEWFSSDEIPAASNSWVGTNVTGYQNPQYDSACRAARLALPDEPAYTDSYHQTENIFAADLPAIPLYYRLRVAAARPGICHFDLDPSANPMWNIEAIDAGEGCAN